jgi:nucleotide-binding universal stress UspA family protein
MKTIVVGTDASTSALDAVAQAAELAAAANAELHIVSVASLARDLALRGVSPLAIPDNYDADAIAVAQGTVEQARTVAEKAGARATTHVLDGDPAGALVDFCDKYQADLLVLGSHGLTGAARFLIGSVTNRCVHHAHCSVLVARPR